MSELPRVPSSSSTPPPPPPPGPQRSASLSFLLPKSTNRKRQLEREAFIDDMKRPKTHSSALLVPLLDVNGECEQRKVLRNRFSFYKETKLPSKLPPMVRQAIDDKRGQHMSLHAALEAFSKKWSQLFSLESEARKEVVQQHRDGWEKILEVMSQNFNGAVVAPELAIALGLTVRIEMRNFAEDEEREFERRKRLTIQLEDQRRKDLADVMLNEAAALRRAAVRQLRAIRTALETAAANAIAEAALEAERQAQRKATALAAMVKDLVDTERTTRAADREPDEVAARAKLHYEMNATWNTAVREAAYRSFLAVMQSHATLGLQEKTAREQLEGEEKVAAIVIRNLILEEERRYAAFRIGQRLTQLVEHEAVLRPVRQALCLKLAAAAIAVSAQDSLLEAYQRTLHRECHNANRTTSTCVVATPLLFLLLVEGEQRERLAASMEQLWADCAAKPITSLTAADIEGLRRGEPIVRRATDTPTSDIVGHPHRSLVASRQLSGRRWSAGGPGVTRVPTGDGGSRRSRPSTNALPPAFSAKMDL